MGFFHYYRHYYYYYYYDFSDAFGGNFNSLLRSFRLSTRTGSVLFCLVELSGEPPGLITLRQCGISALSSPNGSGPLISRSKGSQDVTRVKRHCSLWGGFSWYLALDFRGGSEWGCRSSLFGCLAHVLNQLEGRDGKIGGCGAQMAVLWLGSGWYRRVAYMIIRDLLCGGCRRETML